jgi:hypothetical protein
LQAAGSLRRRWLVLDLRVRPECVGLNSVEVRRSGHLFAHAECVST